jgi:hypothetical protein
MQYTNTHQERSKQHAFFVQTQSTDHLIGIFGEKDTKAYDKNNQHHDQIYG